ncbi:MAG: hypothetical protein ACRDBQ_18615 [Shewanella sp.]
MTGMTQVGGIVSPAPQWRLGEIGQVLADRMGRKIDSVSELNLYMQQNDADLLYGSRLLAQIDALRREVETYGLSRDVAVAVESTRPGTIPSAVQSLLTSNHSRTYRAETLVALESWGNIGKMGLITMAVVAVLKIIAWIVDSGRGYKPATAVSESSAKVVSYREKVSEKREKGTAAPVESSKAAKKEEKEDDTGNIDDNLDPGESFNPPSKANKGLSQTEATVLKDIKTATLVDAFMAVFADQSPRDRKASLEAVMRLDAHFVKTKSADLVDAITAISKRNSIKPLLENISDYNNSALLSGVVTAVLGCNVTDAIYNDSTANAALDMLPRGMRDAGVRLATETVCRITNNVLPELTTFFGQSASAFAKLRDDATKFISANSNYANKQFNGTEAGGQEMGQSAIMFSEAMATLNELLSTIIPSCKRSVNEALTAPTIAVTEDMCNGLIGYDGPSEFVGNKVLITATYEAYLNSSFMGKYLETSTLTDSDFAGVMGAIALLNTKGMSTRTDLTNMDRYSKLQNACEKLIKNIEDWENSMKRNRDSAKLMNDLGEHILQTMMSESKLRASSNRIGTANELIMQYRDEGGKGDFYQSLRKNFGYVRRICLGGVAIQNIINSSQRNPFTRDN